MLYTIRWTASDDRGIARFDLVLVMFFSLLGGLQVFGVLGIVLGPVLFAIAGTILDVLGDPTGASGGAPTQSVDARS